MIEKAPQIDFKPGQTYQANVPFFQYDGLGGKIYILQVIDEQQLSKRYPGPQIVFRCYGKHKQWWHYFIESKSMLEFYIEQVKKWKADPEYCERVKQRKVAKGLNAGI